MAGFLAITLNPLLQSIPVWIAVRLRNRTDMGWWPLIPLFVAFEHLHLNWELTWSWMTLGHAWANFPWYVQYIEWTGVLGASAFILVANIWLFSILINQSSYKYFIGFLILPFILDVWFLYPGRSIYQAEKQLHARIIQPNIDPYEKFDPAAEQKQIETFYKLSTQNLPDSTTLIIFPETAIPHLIKNTDVMDDPALKPILEACRKKDIDLLTGASEYRMFEPGDKVPLGARKYDDRYFQSYNAALMIRDPGYTFYEKAKLVPFVERVPYLEQLQFLQYFSMDLGGAFGNYGLPDSLYCLEDSKKNKIASVICYESIFGSHVRKFVDKGAEVLAILTNDGWWKQTSGYIQHAHYARLRAIETRRAILRSANTGRSLVCYPSGAVEQETDFNTEAYIDAKVPLLKEKTIYVLWGDWFAYLCLILAGFGIIFSFAKKKEKE
jgi:apolipoprotein N-acyltransferase